jgi:hypothetical protein
VGELLGTLSLLESNNVISSEERLDILKGAQLSGALMDDIWTRVAASSTH